MWVEKAAHVSPKMRVFCFFPHQHGCRPLQALKKEHKLIKSQQLFFLEKQKFIKEWIGHKVREIHYSRASMIQRDQSINNKLKPPF
jgi:hypothetical protein